MSTVRSEPMKDAKAPARNRSSLTWSKAAAITAWLIGTFTTWLFLYAAATEVHRLILIPIAGLIQGVLTLAERPLWRFIMRRAGGRFALLGLIITLIDGVINAGGIYPFTGRLAQTDVGKMMA